MGGALEVPLERALCTRAGEVAATGAERSAGCQRALGSEACGARGGEDAADGLQLAVSHGAVMPRRCEVLEGDGSLVNPSEDPLVFV